MKLKFYENMTENYKEAVLGLVGDIVSDLLYYNRKDDEDIPVGYIEEAIKNKYLTIDDMIEEFKTQLYKNIE